MIVFRDQPTGLTIGCNYKVMYSFLTEAGLEKLDGVNECDYLITRNPYARVVSTFFNKLVTVRPPAQHCQQEVLDYFKLKLPLSSHSISFDSFVGALPYLKEDHFKAQTYGNPKFKFAIPMEDLTVLQCALPPIDFTRKVNPTDHQWFEIYYTLPTKAIVAECYLEDFKRLNYPIV